MIRRKAVILDIFSACDSSTKRSLGQVSNRYHDMGIIHSKKIRYSNNHFQVSKFCKLNKFVKSITYSDEDCNFCLYPPKHFVSFVNCSSNVPFGRLSENLVSLTIIDTPFDVLDLRKFQNLQYLKIHYEFLSNTFKILANSNNSLREIEVCCPNVAIPFDIIYGSNLKKIKINSLMENNLQDKIVSPLSNNIEVFDIHNFYGKYTFVQNIENLNNLQFLSFCSDSQEFVRSITKTLRRKGIRSKIGLISPSQKPYFTSIST